MVSFLVILVGFTSAIVLYEDLPWQKEIYVPSKGCSYEKGFEFLKYLTLGPMQHLSTVNQKVGMWSGSPGNFNAYHFKHKDLMENMTEGYATSKFKADATSVVYGFRVEESRALTEPHACFENERCVFSANYSANGWQVSFEKEWLRIHFFDVDVLKRSYPKYESTNATVSFSFIGPSLLQLDFIPISWGIWWEKKVLTNYPGARDTFICEGMSYKLTINGIPDGWLAPNATSLQYEVL